MMMADRLIVNTVSGRSQECHACSCLDKSLHQERTLENEGMDLLEELSWVFVQVNMAYVYCPMRKLAGQS